MLFRMSQHLAALRRQADAVAVAVLGAEGHMAADAGQTDDRGREAEDPLDVLDGHDLAEMIDLLPLGDLCAGCPG